MKNYDHNKVEKKWQGIWGKSKIYEAKTGAKGKKFYGLIEFPYPSGAGLHVGHPRSHVGMDIISRKRRMEGYNVLYPIGWDAFGLPTENYAIKTGIHPAQVTKQNTDTFRRQIKSIGISFDWSREINTTDPSYYKWTQWIFLQMYKKGLAYKKKTEINWCISCKIGLANEEVVAGVCERCGGKVIKKEKEQWMLAITKYADRLDKDLDKVNYLEKIKIQQRNWIGKSEGSEIEFELVPEESEEINKHTHDLIRYKSKIDSFIKENNLKAAYSGGLSIGSFIGKIYRNHEDIDICPLDSDSFKKLKNFLLTEGFIQSTEEGKDEKHFLKFQKEDIKIDLIEVGIDLKKGIYDLEKGKPDYWDASSDKIIKKDGVFYFDPNLVCKLKFRGIEKDLLDKKIAEIFTNKNINVFTTRADTIFGATYVVVAPEHELVTKLKSQITNWKEVENYIKKVKDRPDIERTAEDKVKTGIELKGIKAINPANKEEVPVWIADYVLATYGTGAVMAVPAHDERDFEFAKKYNLPIRLAVEPFFKNTQGSDAIKFDLPFVERQAVVAIIKHWSEDKYLCSFWKKNDWRGFIIGGIENNEKASETAVREVIEETGYKNVEYIKSLGNMHSQFYHQIKNVNRFAHFEVVLLKLKNAEKEEISAEENEIHNVIWLSPEEVEKQVNREDIQFAWSLLSEEKAFTEDGILVNSGEFNGMTSALARKEITEFVGGKIVTKYKLRDWVFSRQRYWGEPIPIIHCDKCGYVPVPEKDLPVILPNIKSYQPTDNGESPLASISKWVNVKCTKCKGKAKRETDTMPNWAGSSWYYLRYTDPKNKKEFASKKALAYWMKNGVDWYNGGMEHTTLHLLYSRFWHKFLYDLKLVPTSEPYMKRTSLGMISGEGGVKMSKSKGNVINPDDIVKLYGADTLRVYEMFLGPFDQTVSWSTESIIGSRRFLDKVWRIGERISSPDIASQKINLKGPRISSPNTLEDEGRGQTISNQSFVTLLHKTIKKITEDIESMSFNTAVSSMMVLVNEMEKTESISIKDFKMFLQILAPFAPHIAEEIWQNLKDKELGGKGLSSRSVAKGSESLRSQSIHKSSWPKWDKKKIVDNQVKIAIQVNGKVRSEISVNKDIKEEEIKILALKDKNVLIWVDNKEIRRFIYIPGRIVNIVV